MHEYKGLGKGKGTKIDIDDVLDEFNRLTLGQSRARGSNDPMPNERETIQDKPRNKKYIKKNKVELKKQKIQNN